ncbi:MAG: membrane dipeptidase [Oscillospiraceae bacterium]|nr:membrane dipeptidase [Oscillospiraceae bacterium]
MRLPVFDLHYDTALALSERAEVYTSLRSNHRHVDLTRAGELGGYCQCFAMFTTPDFDKWYGKSAVEIFDAMLDNLEKELALNSDIIARAGSTAEIEANRAAGKMSAVLTLEGSAGINFDAGRLEELYKRGFRISTLGWNEKNILTGSHVTGGGLTDAGREYVRECQRLGILVDVSHISDEAFWDIMDITEAPIVASHSNLRSVCDHSRNLTEDMYRAIVQTGGTAGINLCAPFIKSEGADFDATCDHILRMLEIDPSGEHVSLGGDLDGCDELPAGFVGIQSYNALADRLLERGLDEQTIRNIYWHNTMGVMDRAVRNHQK